jgi:hypothetical protein
MHGRSLLKRHLSINRAKSLDFGILLCIVGDTESVHGFSLGGKHLWKVLY